MPGMLTQRGGWHSNEVRAFDSVLVQLGQEGYSLNSFTQTLRGAQRTGEVRGQDMVTSQQTSKRFSNILSVVNPRTLHKCRSKVKSHVASPFHQRGCR